MGGGISGSTLAHNLHLSHGIDILLCKSSDRLGGDVRSATVCDEDRIFLYKEGPISFEASPSVMRISRELKPGGRYGVRAFSVALDTLHWGVASPPWREFLRIGGGAEISPI